MLPEWSCSISEQGYDPTPVRGWSHDGTRRGLELTLVWCWKVAPMRPLLIGCIWSLDKGGVVPASLWGIHWCPGSQRPEPKYSRRPISTYRGGVKKKYFFYLGNFRTSFGIILKRPAIVGQCLSPLAYFTFNQAVHSFLGKKGHKTGFFQFLRPNSLMQRVLDPIICRQSFLVISKRILV
jgi:hypothetical protein